MFAFEQELQFEWDKGNSSKNFIKHKVSNEEAEQIFFSQPVIDLDQKHYGQELRLSAIGQTEKQRILFITFTIRGKNVRVISARDANEKERGRYVENQKI